MPIYKEPLVSDTHLFMDFGLPSFSLGSRADSGEDCARHTGRKHIGPPALRSSNPFFLLLGRWLDVLSGIHGKKHARVSDKKSPKSSVTVGLAHETLFERCDLDAQKPVPGRDCD